jgi:hypothetical protein
VATTRRSTGPPPSELIDRAHDPVRLEHAEVVVHLLAREPHANRERRGRAGLGRLRQVASVDGTERHHGGGGILKDFQVGQRFHRTRIGPLTAFVVNGPDCGAWRGVAD